MKNSLKFLLIILSLNMYSFATTNSGEVIYDLLDLNLHPLPGDNTIVKVTTTSLNPFGSSESFLKVTTDSIIFMTIYPKAAYSSGFYTLFTSLATLEPEDNRILGFSATVVCIKPTNNTVNLYTLEKEQYMVQDIDLTQVTEGGTAIKRRDYIKTVTFYNSVTCGASHFMYISLALYNKDDLTHVFLIKRFTLYANLCHPSCEQCSAAPATTSSCDTCAASSYTHQADGTCQCARNPPTLGVVSLNPIINPTSFRFVCQQVIKTNDLSCTTWQNPGTSLVPFDYCSACGGFSYVAQYMALPYTYSNDFVANTVNPSAGQEICKCLPGYSIHLVNFSYKCLTPEQWDCFNSGYDKELDTAALFSYLANIGNNLEIEMIPEANTVLLLSYKITFTIKNAFSIANAINFKVFYTLNSDIVEINVGQDTSKTYAIKINPTFLDQIQECTSVTLSNSAKLWKCKIKFIPYNPCANLAYMNAYIPIEIGVGGITNASPAIVATYSLKELDIPCVLSRQCFVNKDYTTDIYHCADQQCEQLRTTQYFNGDIVWIRPGLTVHNGGSSSSYIHSLEYSSFYFYDSQNNLVASIDLGNKVSTGVDHNSDPVFGFPLEITGEMENAGVLSSGVAILTVTFRLDPKTNRRFLSDLGQYSITSPISMSIHLKVKQSRIIFASALISLLTVIIAAIIIVVLFCLFKKKKIIIEEKKQPEPEQREKAKACSIDTDAGHLRTDSAKELNGHLQKI